MHVPQGNYGQRSSLLFSKYISKSPLTTQKKNMSPSMSICLVHIFICERLWKSCLSHIAYHLNVYQVRGMSSFSCLTVRRFCLSVFYEFLFVRDFENVAYRLSPIASTYTKWVECLHFLFDHNKFLSVCLQCLSVWLSDWYAFSSLRDFEKVAYRLLPIPQHIQSEWNILMQIFRSNSRTCARVHISLHQPQLPVL